MSELATHVLKLLDELRAARAVTNSPADHMTAIGGQLAALDAAYADIHAAVHGEPEAASEPEPEPKASPEGYAPLKAATEA